MPGPPPSAHGPSKRGPGTVVRIRRLPAEGRRKPIPAWPLPTRTKRELEVWGTQWLKPQAVMWEEQQQHSTVARYVRLLVRSEARDSPSTVHAQCTALEDRLGLTPKAMRLLLWVVDDGEDPVERPTVAATGTDGRRRLLRAVDADPGGAGEA